MNTQESRSEAKGNFENAAIAHERWIAAISMVGGAALGATVMYFCDPHRGKARRAELQQKAASAARQGGHELEKKAEDLLNRARGVVARARAACERCEEVSGDDVIADRVRSHMGHITERAGDIQTEVVSGVVALRGTVSAERHRHLVDEVLAVPGVKGVRDLLVSGHSL